MAQIINIKKIGEGITNSAKSIKGCYALLHYSFKHISMLYTAPIRTVLYKQMYFTGIEALSKMTIIGTLIGLVIITQVTNLVGSNAELTGKILAWTVVRELGPLLAAIIIIARSGTAIASELGSMKVNKEMENLRVMGIDPMDYLLIPRIFGITLSVFVITFYFQITAVAGGLAITSILKDIPFLQHIEGIFTALSFFEIAVSLLKSLVFGVLISTVSCYQGFNVKSSITEIPQAATRAVMQSLFFVFIFDGIITLISYV